MYSNDYSILSEDANFDDLWESYLTEASPDKLESVRLKQITSGQFLNSILGFFSHSALDEDKLNEVLKVINANLKIIEKEINAVEKGNYLSSGNTDVQRFVNLRLLGNCLISFLKCAAWNYIIVNPIGSDGVDLALSGIRHGSGDAIVSGGLTAMLAAGLKVGIIIKVIVDICKTVYGLTHYRESLYKYKEVLLQGKLNIEKKILQAKKAHGTLREQQLYNNINLSYIDMLSLKYNI